MTTHALQRLTSSPRSVSTLIHLAGLLSFSASLSYLTKITNPLQSGFGGSYQYLTILALTISTLAFVLGLLSDLSLNKQLFALKNKISVCATPLDVLVTVLYWSLHFVDQEAVVPKGHELPLIPNLGFHAMPAVMLMLDAMLLSPRWEITARGALMLGGVLAAAYLGWVEYCASVNGWYPYPLLELLSAGQKLGLGIGSAVLMMGSTVVLKWVYGWINGVEGVRPGAVDSVKID